MKKLLTCLLLICVTAFTAILTSCSGFFEDESLMIEDIKAELMEDGQTKVTITYLDDVQDPLIFYVPKGETGEDGATGVGIKEIKYDTTDLGNTLLTIYFTDEDLEPVDFEVKNGLKVLGLKQDIDVLTGQHYVVFEYNDGSVSDEIFLPAGKDGNGIKSYTKEQSEDGGWNITFTFDNDEVFDVIIPGPEKGDPGVGIDTGEGKTGIVGGLNADGSKYVITFYYTNGTSESVEFDRPNQWHQSSGVPFGSIGKNGDFCFDTTNNDVYVKKSNQWVNIFDFDSVEESHTITFDVNAYNEDGSRDTNVVFDGQKIYSGIKHNSFFKDNGFGAIPVPVRPGYKFLGWYTEKSENPVSGKFTTLTPIVSNIDLYAWWEKV